jgi:threonine dehydrogenase-like Zn-dependent dehydrogenase
LRVIGLDSDGGFAPYASVPSIRIHEIPDSISYDRAALCEPVTVAVHMVRRAGVKVGDSVAILGAGPIGILVAMVAREAGASKIVLSDINPFRLNLAKEFGFKVLNGNEAGRDAFLDYLGEEGADVTFELAAQESTINLVTAITKIRGTILPGGIFKNPPRLQMQEMTLKEQHFLGSRLYNFSDFEAAIDLLEKETFGVEKLITKKLSIDEVIPKGFEAIKNGEDVMKVLIKMD